jgi:integrase
MAAHFGASIPLACNVTFARAAESYVTHGGEGRSLPRIVEHFGDQPLASITPFDVRQMAQALYPDQSNATRNRCALTPARSVLIHGYERGWCPLMRLPRFRQEPPKRKSPASVAWLQIFVRQCDRDGLHGLAALVIFMSQTGARVSEAVELRWSEVDLFSRKVLLLKTKTTINSERGLSDAMVKRLRQLAERGVGPDDHVFGYRSRFSINDRIRAVCQRAGIPYKSSHACGRHSFATNAILMGTDVKATMEAGSWKSVDVFMGTYVHVRNAARLVADRFNGIEFDVL